MHIYIMSIYICAYIYIYYIHIDKDVYIYIWTHIYHMHVCIQPIADRVEQNLEIISKHFNLVPGVPEFP